MSYGYIMKLHGNVMREHVRYSNRYGIAIAADLYRAKNPMRRLRDALSFRCGDPKEHGARQRGFRILRGKRAF